MHRVEEVHAAEVFRTRQHAGQLANRDGRGIGCENGVRAHFRFGFGQYRFFDFRVFHHRFNHHVHAFKPGVVEGRMNRADHARELQTVDFAALQLFVKQLTGLVHPKGEGLLVNVFHDHRHAFPGRLVSDTATHNPGAQHRSLFRGLGLFGQLLRFAFDVLVIEEDTDQRPGFV